MTGYGWFSGHRRTWIPEDWNGTPARDHLDRMRNPSSHLPSLPPVVVGIPHRPALLEKPGFQHLRTPLSARKIRSIPR